MGFTGKVRGRTRVSRGRVKQRLGRATGDRRLRAQGMADRLGGGMREFGEELRDAGRVIRRSLRR
jgi:uncharacterized protein YjbJ (UPF0337 family)